MGNIFPSCVMVDCALHPAPCVDAKLGNQTNQLCLGIHTGSGGNQYVYGSPKRVPIQRCKWEDIQRLCPLDQKELLWTKTRGPGLESALSLEAGFAQSAHDECSAMDVLYMDDSILTGPNKRELDEIIRKMGEMTSWVFMWTT